MSLTILVNHIGYEVGCPKRAMVTVAGVEAPARVVVLREPDGDVVWEGPLDPPAPVANWKRGEVRYGACDFSTFDQVGSFRLRAGSARSAPFAVARRLLLDRTGRALFYYFRGQRCRGIYDEADRQAPFFGSRGDRVDVHGGWYDASGDLSKYLSHLSYANFMNPQQTPLVVYNLLASADLLEGDSELVADLRGEAAYGGDFLVRMQDPAGYFYMTLFDRWSKKPEQREICAYRTQQGTKLESYQAGYRQGGGVTIAALARLFISGAAGESPRERYLEAAETGFAHLEAHNREYLDDGRENVIDDYCALLAAAELFAATSNGVYRAAAERRAASLVGRLARDGSFRGYWRADDGERPFFHAAEAGFPVVALLRWAETGAADPGAILGAVAESLRFETAVTDEVANPFGYARQYVQPLGQPPRTSFFFPHQNESGYWWQGENARLASLAAAVALALPRIEASAAERQRLLRYAHDQLDWILGRNPYDTCLLHGFGRNNRDYLPGWPNYPGGISNGITSGFDDEEDVAFLPEPHASDMTQNWRWAEQWLPHGAWFLYAVTALARAAGMQGAHPDQG